MKHSFWIAIVSLLVPGLPHAQDAVEDATILLKEEDIVSVSVFGEDSLSGGFQVGPEGTIVFPLLGTIEAVDLTPDQLEAEIEKRLEADYIRDAQVAVALAEEAEPPPNVVTVIGQVTSPGRIPWKVDESMDLFTAVASAGGLTERGDSKRIELKRKIGGDITTRTVDLEKDRVLPLRDEDTIVVQTIPREEEVATVTIIGEVGRPGRVPMDPEDPLDIISAIAIAGGFRNTARPSKVVVRRRIEGGTRTFEVNVSKMQKGEIEPFILAPDDTVSVPESIF